SMAETAENLAKELNISREEVDQHALSSHERALKAREKGYLAEEIVPVTIKGRKGEIVVDEDDHIRETNMEQLGKLKPRCVENGVVTAAMASGMVDGAAAAGIASAGYAEKHGLTPIAKLVSWDVTGVAPEIMGIGPVPAIKNAAEKAKLTVE